MKSFSKSKQVLHGQISQYPLKINQKGTHYYNPEKNLDEAAAAGPTDIYFGIEPCGSVTSRRAFCALNF